MRHLLSLALLLLLTGLSAQADTDWSYVDVVDVRGGRKEVGTVIDYRHGQYATLALTNGDTLTLPWGRIKNIRFEVDRRPTPAAPARADQPAVLRQALPDRLWYHQVTATAGLSSTATDPNNQFVTTRNNLSAGAAYHYVRPLNAFAVGLGGGAEIMSAVNNERVVTLTGLIEYQLGRGRVRPVARLLAGGNLPLGHRDLQLDSRQIGTVIHPSLGLVLAPPERERGTLLFDIGYRLTGVTFTTTDRNLEVVRRDITYRRLTFTLGTRF